MPDVGLTEAARELAVSAGTLRRWLRQGAPCARPGEVGRGHGARVDIEAVRRWRAGVGLADAAALLDRVACALWSTYTRDAGHGEPAHASLGIRHRAAAGLLYVAYTRIARELTGGEIESLPAQIDHLWTISVG